MPPEFDKNRVVGNRHKENPFRYAEMDVLHISSPLRPLGPKEGNKEEEIPP
jgi:hypothetical protein